MLTYVTIFVLRKHGKFDMYDCDFQTVVTNRIEDCVFLKVHVKYMSKSYSLLNMTILCVINDPLQSSVHHFDLMFEAAFSKGTQLANELLFEHLRVLLLWFCYWFVGIVDVLVLGC